MIKSRGFSLIEVLVAMGFVVVLILAGAQLYLQTVRVQMIENERSTLVQLRNQFMSYLMSKNSWDRTAQNNSDLACAYGCSSCPLGLIGGGNFKVYNSVGGLEYDPLVLSNGFTSKGVACSSFPSENCPFRAELDWNAICLTCNPKLIKVNFRIASHPSRANRNLDKFKFSVLSYVDAPLELNLVGDQSSIDVFNYVGSPTIPRKVIVHIAHGAIVRGENPQQTFSPLVSAALPPPLPALRTGVFPACSNIKIINEGEILGAGGAGGSGADSATASPFIYQYGQAGGAALRVDVPSTEVINLGKIAGGGGGGGAGGQGGAGGTNGCTPAAYDLLGATQGLPGSDSGPGTPSTGSKYDSESYWIDPSLPPFAPRFPVDGEGGPGGAGGDFGMPGNGGGPGTGSCVTPGGPGGAAGPAVIGNANIIWTNPGVRIGPIF